MSADSEELPEHQIFYVLKKGEQESLGPYSQRELVSLLNSEEIRPSDLVYYPELTDWTPLSQVFELHQEVTNYGEDGQDKELVAATFAFMERRSEPDEDIYYIAVQHIPARRLTATVKLRAPRSVVLTNCRFCVVKPKLMGDMTFDEYLIDQIELTDISLDSGDADGAFEIVPRFGDPAIVDQIPAAQLKRLERFSKSLLEKAVSEG